MSAEEQRAFQTLLTDQQQREASRADRIRDFLARGAGSGVRQIERREIEAAQLAHELAGLGKDSALAFYLLTDTKLRVLIATRRGQFEYESTVDAAALRKEIGQFLDAISRREDVRGASRKLYDALARPVDTEARRAGAKRLVIWLDGPLRYVPFSVLHDGRQYLVDRYAIESYQPLAANPAARSRSALSVRGLGLTRAVGGFEALAAMADELCDVVHGPIEGLEIQGRRCPRAQFGEGALEGAGFADAAFTSARFQSLLSEQRDFSVLHLGTHFSLRPGNARKSYLVLGDGSRLTLDSIASLDFSGLQLVTLSACQSGLGGAITDDGREVEGLSAIVQRRGAEHVVASLWRVEDRSTAMLMREMYRSLADRKTDTAEALRRSQIRVRSERDGASHPYEHPYYWGGFLVSASPSAWR
jgi:CHAT domain-containing protein